MEGSPRTPILFSLKRIAEPSPPSGFESALEVAPPAQQKLPVNTEVGGLSGGMAPTRIMRIRRHGRVARWRRKGVRLLRRVQSLLKYRRPVIAASLIVLVAGGGYRVGSRIVEAFSMRHEIVAAPAPIPVDSIAEEVKSVRPQRAMAARNVVVPKNVLPEQFVEPVKRPEVDDVPVLRLSAEGTPEAFRRRTRQAVYQSSVEVSADVVPPVIQANGVESRLPPSSLIGGIETEFSSHQEQQIHVTPGSSNR